MTREQEEQLERDMTSAAKILSGIWVLLAVIAIVAVVAGCSGGKYYQSQPMDSQIGSDVYHYHNAVQLNLPATMFHATQSVNWMEYCKTKIEDPNTEAEFLYPYKDCVREDAYRLTTMGSVASQFITPVVTTAEMAGGMVGMGYFIGNGLSKSGTTVNQSGGGANAEASSKAGASTSVNSGNKTTNIKPSTNINSNNVFKK